MTSSQSQEIFTNNQKRNILSKLIEECNDESDIDKKIQLFTLEYIRICTN